MASLVTWFLDVRIGVVRVFHQAVDISKISGERDDKHHHTTQEQQRRRMKKRRNRLTASAQTFANAPSLPLPPTPPNTVISLLTTHVHPSMVYVPFELPTSK